MKVIHRELGSIIILKFTTAFLAGSVGRRFCSFVNNTPFFLSPANHVVVPKGQMADDHRMLLFSSEIMSFSGSQHELITNTTRSTSCFFNFVAAVLSSDFTPIFTRFEQVKGNSRASIQSLLQRTHCCIIEDHALLKI